MLIAIDCSKIKTQFRQDLFMANRSNLRKSDKLEKLRAKIIEILKGNETLRKLNTERKDKVLQGGDDKKEKELIKNLLSKVPLDKSLENLLKKGTDLLNLPNKQKPTNKKGNKPEQKPIPTKRFPSIFKINIKENNQGKKVKSIPLNGKGIIKFETDVESDYFYRPQEKGGLQIQILGGRSDNESEGGTEAGKPNEVEDYFEVTQSGPKDGSIKLTLKPLEDLSVGEEIELNARLTSPDGDMESIFYVKIVDPQNKKRKKQVKNPKNQNYPSQSKSAKMKKANGFKIMGNYGKKKIGEKRI